MTHVLTHYELTEIAGLRALQLSTGTPYTLAEQTSDPLADACRELEESTTLDMVVRRPLPDGTFVDVSVAAALRERRCMERGAYIVPERFL